MSSANIFTGNAVSDSIQFVLLIVVVVLGILGNGSVYGLLLRFKTLRTIPNLLVLDLSIVDGLNVVINATLFAAYFVVEVDVLHGRPTAVFTEVSYRVFLFLNLTTKLLMMLDRYLVINNGVRYTAWKSRSKVLLVLTLKWLFCLTVGIVSTAGLWKIDLGNAQVLEYRSEYLETNGKMIKRLTIIINHALYTCLGIATFYSIRKTNKALKCISKDVKTDLTKVSNSGKVKASKTVVLMVFCDFVFYLPMLMHLYMVLARGFQKHGWFPFFAHYFVFVSSVNNPIIYYSRTQRFRMALLKLLRDPCGSDEVFELRTLPKVVLPDEKPRQHRGFRKHTARNAAKVTKEIHEMQVHIGPADTAEGREVRGPERESASGVRSSTPVGDHPFAFVHWSAIDDVDPDAKYVQREVQVIVSNQPSSNKGKSSGDSARSQSLPKEKQRTTTGGGTRPQDSSYASSSDLTQESGLTVTSISEDSSVECYDTRL